MRTRCPRQRGACGCCGELHSVPHPQRVRPQVLQAEAAVLAGQAAEMAEEKAKVLAAELDRAAEKGAEVMAEWWSRGSLWAERVMKTTTDKLHSPARPRPQVRSLAVPIVKRLMDVSRKNGQVNNIQRGGLPVLRLRGLYQQHRNEPPRGLSPSAPAAH
jgi:hypothetical protein